MIKVYNHNRTIRLTSLDGSSMILAPNSFANVDEKFMGCDIWKMAVEAKEIEPFVTTREGDALEEKARTPRKKAAEA